MVLSTALFGKPAFRNLICNGLVLAEDGKKMSKKLRNYPPPLEVIDEYGAVSCPCNMLLCCVFSFLFLFSVRLVMEILAVVNTSLISNFT